MALPNTELWGSLMPGGDPAGSGGIDTQVVIDRILPTLRTDTRANLTYWTEADLIAWMDDALKRLARIALVFVGRDATRFTVASQAAYPLPPQHISSLHVSRGSTSLRPANQLELEARDENYLATAGTPKYWYQDQLGQASIGLAPIPTMQEPIAILFEGWPQSLDPSGSDSLVAGPAPLNFYLAMSALAGAYGREGDMEMPDVAAHCASQATMMEAAFAHYWGPGV